MASLTHPTLQEGDKVGADEMILNGFKMNPTAMRSVMEPQGWLDDLVWIYSALLFCSCFQ